MPSKITFRRSLLLSILLFSLCPTLLFAGQLPEDFEATYTIRKAGINLAKVVITFKREGNHYRYKKYTRTKGVLSLFRKDKITEISTGAIENNQIHPSQYDYRHQRGKKLRESRFTLDKKGTAIGKHKSKTFNIPVPDNVLDRASVELALMRDAGTKNKILEYPVVDHGKLFTQRFEPKGKKRVSLPSHGAMECQVYQVARTSKKRSTELCVAAELGFLPIQAIHNEKGTTVEMLLLKFESTRHSLQKKPPQQDLNELLSANQRKD